MNPNNRKQRRRALTRCFFFHNRTAAFLAMSAVILNIPLNLAVAWQMQQLIDIVRSCSDCGRNGMPPEILLVAEAPILKPIGRQLFTKAAAVKTAAR